MTDPRPDADPGTTASAANPADSEATPVSGSDRRAFLRQLSGDAVSTAGRLAGFSSIIRRSMVAAGATVTRSLETSSLDDQPGDATPDVAVPDMPAPRPEPGPAPAALLGAPAPAPQAAMPDLPDPVVALTPAQHGVLTGATSATLAVNDPAGPPHLTSSMVHWDGSIVRLPSQLFTARATNVDRDGRVSLLVHDSNSEAWVAITGVASIVYGDQAEDDTRLILAKYFAEDEAARRWAEMAATGDPIVIRVRPTRFIWRSA